MTDAQATDRHLLVDVQRNDSRFALQYGLNDVVILVDQMRWILWRTRLQVKNTAYYVKTENMITNY